MISYVIKLHVCCILVILFQHLLHIIAETTPSAISNRISKKNILQVLRFQRQANCFLSSTENAIININPATLGNNQHFTKAENNSLKKQSLSFPIEKRDINDFKTDKNYDDLEAAEINLFRPLFQYRLAYGKQVRNTQHRQLGYNYV